MTRPEPVRRFGWGPHLAYWVCVVGLVLAVVLVVIGVSEGQSWPYFVGLALAVALLASGARGLREYRSR